MDEIKNTFSFDGLKKIPTTMKLHQLKCQKQKALLYRDVSCMCEKGRECCENNTFKHFSFRTESEEEMLEDGNAYVIEDEHVVAGSTEPELFASVCNRSISEKGRDDKKFHVFLEKLGNCQSFGKLVDECESQMLWVREVYGSQRSVLETRIRIDDMAKQFVPGDIPFHSHGHLFPVTVSCDGDCLPACGAVFARGKDMCPEEIRVRIIQELAINADYYLDNKNLLKGSKAHVSDCVEVFSSYLDQYVPGLHILQNSLVRRELFEKEVMSLVNPGSYMGIWQLFGLASVLKMKVISVFPKMPCSMTRDHLHRAIEPRLRSSDEVAHIMWSSTRLTKRSIFWRPNHFVPLLPFNSTVRI